MEQGVKSGEMKTCTSGNWSSQSIHGKELGILIFAQNIIMELKLDSGKCKVAIINVGGVLDC